MTAPDERAALAQLRARIQKRDMLSWREMENLLAVAEAADRLIERSEVATAFRTYQMQYGDVQDLVAALAALGVQTMADTDSALANALRARGYSNMQELIDALHKRRGFFSTDHGVHWYLSTEPDGHCEDAAIILEALSRTPPAPAAPVSEERKRLIARLLEYAREQPNAGGHLCAEAAALLRLPLNEKKGHG